MTERNQHVSGDNLALRESNKRSPTSRGETDHFGLISVDLFINILSRLPVKSLGQCRCVSSLWSSIIRRPNYKKLFPIKSPVTLSLLFAFKVGSDLSFYSSLQPQDPDENSSLVATRQRTNLGEDFYLLCPPVRGLVCSHHIGNNYSWVVISNPVTGECVATPKVSIAVSKSRRIKERAEYSFGYDPIEDQYKVLRITWLSSVSEYWDVKYHVLTLETGDGNPLWRLIQCPKSHYPLDDNGICIDGLLYYPAMIDNKMHTMVCFNVRSEEFSFVNVDKNLARKFKGALSLVDYNGKLCVNHCNFQHSHFELWVLEDVEKHRWSKRIYQMNHPWLKETSFLRLAGMIDNGDIVLYPIYSTPQDPFFIFYYNLETNVTRRVRLDVPICEVSEELYHFRTYTFPNYVECL